MSIRSPASRRLLLLSLVLAACKTTTVAAPYAEGAAPPAQELLERIRPPLDAISVPQARIRANRGVRGDLAFLAQAPDRFRASVTVAGNEMVSVSLFDDGYDLIYKLDDLPQGYYHGSSSACAVQVLLGVPLDGTQLVTVVLGGVPIIDSARVVEQRWDEHVARERLHLTNGVHDQELRFAAVDGQWRFSGASLWRREGPRRVALWSLDHDSWHSVDGVILPKSTRLRRPVGPREDVVRIDYRAQDPNPAFARAQTPVRTGSEKEQTQQAHQDATSDPSNTSDDPWGEGGAWEGEGAPAPPPAGEEAPPPTASSPSPPEPTQSARPSPTSVPDLFRLKRGTLPDRGDVCRRVRS